ncbi:MAG TPA: hypothetical protein VLJ59_15225 [Mycobacteriales bacterium]|nr:hypothetical protein [Mycobacteriales bacterium]
MTRSIVLMAAVLGGLAGCSANVPGQATGPAAATTTTPTPSATAPTTPGSIFSIGPPETTRPATPSASGGARTTRPPASPPPRTPTPAPKPTGTAQILSYRATAGPSCTTNTGTSKVTLTWRSKNATVAWIQPTPVAVGAGDPKTIPGASGPLPPNGSATLSFDCAAQSYYYVLGVYNTGNGTQAASILPVSRKP